MDLLFVFVINKRLQDKDELLLCDHTLLPAVISSMLDGANEFIVYSIRISLKQDTDCINDYAIQLTSLTVRHHYDLCCRGPGQESGILSVTSLVIPHFQGHIILLPDLHHNGVIFLQLSSSLQLAYHMKIKSQIEILVHVQGQTMQTIIIVYLTLWYSLQIL